MNYIGKRVVMVGLFDVERYFHFFYYSINKKKLKIILKNNFSNEHKLDK